MGRGRYTAVSFFLLRAETTCYNITAASAYGVHVCQLTFPCSTSKISPSVSACIPLFTSVQNKSSKTDLNDNGFFTEIFLLINCTDTVDSHFVRQLQCTAVRLQLTALATSLGCLWGKHTDIGLHKVIFFSMWWGFEHVNNDFTEWGNVQDCITKVYIQSTM